MLPSGNDAALVIANFLGNILKKESDIKKGNDEKLSKKCEFKKRIKHFVN